MDKQTDRPYEVAYIVESPDQALGILEKFTTSAEGIAKFTHLVTTEVKEGRVDPLRVALFMKTMEKIKDQVNEVLAPYYLSEAQKYSGKSFEYRGTEIAVGEVGTRYNFATCGHPGWNDLERIRIEAVAQQKPIEELLKAMKEPTVLVLDGEAVEVRPPTKSAKMGIKISIR